MSKFGLTGIWVIVLSFLSHLNLTGQCNKTKDIFDPGQNVLHPSIYQVSDTSEFKLNPCVINSEPSKGIISTDEVLNNNWYYMMIGNQSEARSLILELDNSQTDIIDIYQYDQNGIQKILNAGDLVPYSNRIIQHRNILLPFESTSSTSTFLLNVRNRATYGIPVNIFTQSYYEAMDDRRSLIIGMYLGLVILFILFVSASLVLAEYDHTHFYYLLYLIFTGLYFFVELGYGDVYFWPSSPQLEEPFIFAFVLGSTFSFLMLIYHLFKVQESKVGYLILFRILFGLIITAIVLLLSGLIRIDSIFIIQYYLVLFVVGATFFYALVIGYNAVRRRVAYAKYFLLAFSIMILGVVVKPLSLLGIIPFNIYIHYGGIIGHSFEIICLSTLLLLEFFRRMRYSHSLETEIVRLEKSALQAQMNPHFIFNCLNSIQNYIAINEKRKAMVYLTQFAKLIRNTLEASASTSGTISLQKEIDMLENYIQMEQMRFKGKFDYKLVYDDELDLDDIVIPPMMIQPFAENAIIHGFKGIKEKGLLKISFNMTDEDLIVLVEDNGVGYHPEKSDKTHKSMAMSITGQRLKFYNDEYPDADNILVENNHENKGTTVTIRIQLSEYE
ncbi:MAG: histidine kinase [Saprospiraceae bacterium]|nr:histidine kinase [Saprospiraceae bacterium]